MDVRNSVCYMDISADVVIKDGYFIWGLQVGSLNSVCSTTEIAGLT